MNTVTLRITGMTCAACASRVEKAAKSVDGVYDVSVNLLVGKLSFTYDQKNPTDDIILAITKAGYGAEHTKEQKTRSDNTQMAPETNQLARRLWLSLAFLIPLLYLTMGGMVGLPLPNFLMQEGAVLTFALVQLCLTLPVLYINRAFFERGFSHLFHLSPNMDSLVALGASASIVYGIYVLFMTSHLLGQGDIHEAEMYRMSLYFESAAMICTLIVLGKYFEAKSKGKTSEALKKLLSLAPDTVILEREGEQITLSADEVKRGDIILVKTGMRIAVDGVVIDGHATVDESAMTGESMPQEKGVGDHVICSSVNTSGVLRIRAEAVGADTAFSHMTALVEQASATKAPIAKLADKVAGVFVPCVMGISLITWIIWLLCGATFAEAFNFAITVLVIACPCALGLATPVAVMVGVGRGATLGLLFKSGEALEIAHHIDTIVFDKTGTLTEGKPHVTNCFSFDINEAQLLAYVTGLEQYSTHPLSCAIMAYAKSQQIIPAHVTDATEHTGKGMSGYTASHQRLLAGNEALLKENGLSSLPIYEKIPSLSSEGKTLIFVALDDHIIGVLGLADKLKPTSKEGLLMLKKMGIETMMLTGDSHQTAATVASELPLSAYEAGLLPQDKSAIIQKLQSEGKRVGMVGDGINDAPSLVIADVGIAIGAGTDIAMESADIVLVHSDVRDVAQAIMLSRRVMRTIKQNLFWAFFYNCLGIPLAAGVLYPAFKLALTPAFGALAMSFSSLFVVGNALRLKRALPQKASKNTTQITCDTCPCETKEDRDMITLKIEGMMCMHCVAHVKKALEGIAGVSNVDVSLENGTATVDGHSLDGAVLSKAITDAGYTVVSVE